MDRQHKDFRWVAWHIEALRRASRLISFAELMGEKPQAQDVDELIDELDRWFTMHNAKLSADERRAEVMEV